MKACHDIYTSGATVVISLVEICKKNSGCFLWTCSNNKMFYPVRTSDLGTI